MEPSSPPATISVIGRFCDVIFGIVASFFAILAGILVWGVLFDSTGGEPFSSTVFGAIFMWPILLIVIVSGPIAWWHYRIARSRLIIFGAQMLGTHAAIGLSWFMG